MRDISNLITAVTLNASISAAAVQALVAAEQHLADVDAQLATLRPQYDAGAVDPDQLTRLLDTVSTTTAQLSAAIPANTAPAAGAGITGTAASGTALPLAGADAAVQARDAAAAVVPAVGTAVPGTPGAFAQPTDAATAGLAAGPGPVVVPQP